MESRLGPLLVECDAPPFEVVVASQAAGFWTPADVRWCRVDARQQAPNGWLPWLCSWLSPGRGHACRSCSHRCPELKRCLFDRQGEMLLYTMGQCQRCLTIYWAEADPAHLSSLE